MALILGVQKGSKLYFNDTMVEVTQIHGYRQMLLRVNDQIYAVTAQESVEILPQVFVSIGLPKETHHDVLPRLVIEAPKRIVILREELYVRSRSKIPATN